MVKTTEGVPEGWELIRIGIPKYSEHYIDYEGYIRRCDASPSLHSSTHHPIVRERLFYYIAKKDLSFMDESTHIKGRCYFPSPESQAYFDVMKKHYEKMILETEEVDGRTIASPRDYFQ